MANTTISVANVEFAAIKTSLKTYLSSQSRFNDYDFEGSNISVLLDVLAYNTYMNNFYLNMVASESFIDSAQLRDSGISHAKTLSYVPRSYTSSKAVIDLQIYPTGNPATVVVPKYTEFTSSIDNVTYSFTTDSVLSVSADEAGTYRANNVSLYEGDIVSELYTANTSNPSQKFAFSNKDIDVSSLTVKVVASSTDSSNSEYVRASTVVGLDGSSNVYYIVPALNDKYEIQFGDGVLGRALDNGNIVQATYRRSSSSAADGVSSFSLSGDIQGYSNVAIFVRQRSQGGSQSESIESIKFNAVKSLSIQDRTVTTTDYQTLILQQFPDIESINVFGGEELDPPRYGRVAISVDLKNADGVSLTRQREIETFVKSRAPLTTVPIIITPEFLYVNIATEVIYNPNVTTLSPVEIQSLVSAAISTFAVESINGFSGKCRTSKLVTTIDNASPSILNNNTTLTLQRNIVPELNATQNFRLDFANEILQESSTSISTVFVDGTPPIRSSTFVYNGLTACSLSDDGEGTMMIVRDVIDGGVVSRSIVVRNAGTVDYAKGIVNITSLKVSSHTGSAINVIANPKSRSVSSSKNIILQYLAPSLITITTERN